MSGTITDFCFDCNAPYERAPSQGCSVCGSANVITVPFTNEFWDFVNEEWWERRARAIGYKPDPKATAMVEACGREAGKLASDIIMKSMELEYEK